MKALGTCNGLSLPSQHLTTWLSVATIWTLVYVLGKIPDQWKNFWRFWLLIWGFPKIVVPQNGWFIMETRIKMDDLGGKPTILGFTPISSFKILEASEACRCTDTFAFDWRYTCFIRIFGRGNLDGLVGSGLAELETWATWWSYGSVFWCLDVWPFVVLSS